MDKGPEGTDKRRSLLCEYYPLARTIARRTWARMARGVDPDDLESAAVLGLFDAVDRYEPGRGVSFQAYAKHRIQGAVLDSLRATDWVPRAVRRRANTLAQTRKLLHAKFGRAPTPREIALYLDIDPDELRKLQRDADPLPLLSLDAPVGEEDGLPLSDCVTDEYTPEDVVLDQERRDALIAAVGLLPERERAAVVLFYFRELSLREIAGVLGVGQSRVSQLCAQGIRRLREVDSANRFSQARLWAAAGPDRAVGENS